MDSLELQFETLFNENSEEEQSRERSRKSIQSRKKQTQTKSDEKYVDSVVIDLQMKVERLYKLKPETELKATAYNHIDNAKSCINDELYEQAYCHLWKATELLWKING